MRLREIPVIMISAVDEMDSVVRCIEGGAEDHLPKPFNAALLRARVHASLEKKRLRDQEAGYLKQIEVEKKRADDLLQPRPRRPLRALNSHAPVSGPPPGDRRPSRALEPAMSACGTQRTFSTLWS